MRILVAGASGYIGGRLTARLLQQGHQVRALVRNRAKLEGKPWADQVEIIQADANDGAALEEAMRGCQAAYYLLHSLSDKKGFHREEELTAKTFTKAAQASGLERIIYLGGIINPDEKHLSEHLSSRQSVGHILASGKTPCIELRAAVIIGSGSASFEMLRYLSERLPIMTTPTWVRTRIQPIAVRDVLTYLTQALTLPAHTRTYDIGGPDILTYEQMITRYARIAGLKPRTIIPVPVLSPGLSSHWVGLITPVPPAIAKPLVESLRHEVICHENDIDSLLPARDKIGFDEAVARALARIQDDEVATSWADATWPGAPDQPWPGDPHWAGGSLYKDIRTIRVHASAQNTWEVIEGIGGQHGWYSWKLAWQVRGLMDRAVGGAGLRRGRRNPDKLQEGDALDFWRVEKINKGRLLRLRAEMRLPGLAWLEWHIEEDKNGCVVTQRALFAPRGLAGHAYWRSVAPFHAFVFAPMLKSIGEEAQRRTRKAALEQGRLGSTKI